MKLDKVTGLVEIEGFAKGPTDEWETVQMIFHCSQIRAAYAVASYMGDLISEGGKTNINTHSIGVICVRDDISSIKSIMEFWIGREALLAKTAIGANNDSILDQLKQIVANTAAK